MVVRGRRKKEGVKEGRRAKNFCAATPHAHAHTHTCLPTYTAHTLFYHPPTLRTHARRDHRRRGINLTGVIVRAVWLDGGGRHRMISRAVGRRGRIMEKEDGGDEGQEHTPATTAPPAPPHPALPTHLPLAAPPPAHATQEKEEGG